MSNRVGGERKLSDLILDRIEYQSEHSDISAEESHDMIHELTSQTQRMGVIDTKDPNAETEFIKIKGELAVSKAGHRALILERTASALAMKHLTPTQRALSAFLDEWGVILRLKPESNGADQGRQDKSI